MNSASEIKAAISSSELIQLDRARVMPDESASESGALKMSRDSAELRPQLAEAQENLGNALKEACSMDVSTANTGELIQIDELLAIANESAKKAISVRRRLKLGKKD
jgi:hypothetical protein